MIVVDPMQSKRASAYQLWMNAPNPMVTFFKRFNVEPLIRLNFRRGYKFNMLMCWCIGLAASQVEEFFTLPVGRDLIKYDTLTVNTIVKNRCGEVTSCDIPFTGDFSRFQQDYLHLTTQAHDTCENHDLTDSMVIGTSAVTNVEIDGVVGMNSGIYNNPFLIWGKYHRGFFKTTLNVSFQFHHTQMDGAHAGRFLAALQENINHIKNTIKK